MTLSLDIKAARDSGQADDYLLGAYKAYDPTKVADIDAALEAGRSTKDILDALGAYDDQFGNHIENQGFTAKTTGALQQGVSSELTGLASTARQTIGAGDRFGDLG